MGTTWKCSLKKKKKKKNRKKTKSTDQHSKIPTLHLWMNRENLYPDLNFTVENKIHSAFTCPKLTIETLEQGVKYVKN